MADTRREEQARRFVSLASGRLAQNRWTLAAGVLAILAMHFYAGGSALFTAAAILLFFVVTAFAPRRTRRQRQADLAAAGDGGELDGLSAQNLAAAVNDPLIIFDAAGSAVHANDTS